MGAVPGFSVNDLIAALDWTIKFIIELNQVPDQVHGFRKDLETSRDQLKGLEEVLKKTHDRVNHRAASFKTLQTQLYEILNDSINLLQRFHRADHAQPQTPFPTLDFSQIFDRISDG